MLYYMLLDRNKSLKVITVIFNYYVYTYIQFISEIIQ
jgi:hypothetical protein